MKNKISISPSGGALVCADRLKSNQPPPELPPMEMQLLKDKTRHTWSEFHKLQDCVIPNEDAFLAEIEASYGDLAQVSTWETAWASFYAKFLADSVLDEPVFLIEFYLIQGAHKENWKELMPLVLEKIAEIPAALEALLDGINDLLRYGTDYNTDESAVKDFLEVASGVEAIRERGFGIEPTGGVEGRRVLAGSPGQN